MRRAVIVSTARTPIGRAFRGAFNETQPQALAGHAIAEAVRRAGVDPAEIDDVIIGAAIQQGAQGFNIARQSALRAGLPDSVPAMSIDRQCSSGMMAIATAAKEIIDDGMQIAVGGGVESVSFVQGDKMVRTRGDDPELMARIPALYMTMIETAEIVAERYNISREAQDEYALRSQQRTAAAQQAGRVRRRDRRAALGDERHRPQHRREIDAGGDPGQGRGQPPRHQSRGPRRPETGVQGRTAGQGGPLHHRRQRLATVGRRLGRGADGGERGRAPRAHTARASIAASRSPAARPTRWASARSSPCRSCLKQHGLTIDDIDLWELNEAFACQVVYCRDRLGIPHDRLNVNGGAISIGHPYGMSGARMVGHALIEGKAPQRQTRRLHDVHRRRHGRRRPLRGGVEPTLSRGAAPAVG